MNNKRSDLYFVRAQAFTLIEFLVTIAIVGVMASISVAQFSEYRSKAYDVEALSAAHLLKDVAMTLESEMELEGFTTSTNCFSITSRGGRSFSCPISHAQDPLVAKLMKLIPQNLYTNPRMFIGYNALVSGTVREFTARARHCDGKMLYSWRGQYFGGHSSNSRGPVLAAYDKNRISEGGYVNEFNSFDWNWSSVTDTSTCGG